MSQLNAATVAQRWAQNLGGATAKIQAGVQAVTTAPQQKAAASVQKWLAALNNPATAQKYVASLQKGTLQDWQNATLQKGLSRVASGAQAAIPKMQAFLQSFLPFQANITQQVRSMPSVTLEDRINRMVAQVRGTAAYRGQHQ